MLTKLKSKICSTGGHIKKTDADLTVYVLQGNKKEELNKYLLALGVKKDMILNIGTI
uniref:SUI1 domain-containing protein n=1 Tax=viral metagenome TaxID=1070528 RepID=A0A6C0J9Z3_9ZZZZ